MKGYSDLGSLHFPFKLPIYKLGRTTIQSVAVYIYRPRGRVYSSKLAGGNPNQQFLGRYDIRLMLKRRGMELWWFLPVYFCLIIFQDIEVIKYLGRRSSDKQLQLKVLFPPSLTLPASFIRSSVPPFSPFFETLPARLSLSFLDFPSRFLTILMPVSPFSPSSFPSSLAIYKVNLKVRSHQDRSLLRFADGKRNFPQDK